MKLTESIYEELERLDASSDGRLNGIGVSDRDARHPGEEEGRPLPAGLLRFADAGGSECYADGEAALAALRRVRDGATYDEVWAAIPGVERPALDTPAPPA